MTSRRAHFLIGLLLGAFGPAAQAADPAKILVHGHRGARALRPENTIPAFEYAIGVGVDALELDMAVTRDNVIVVSHDPVLRPPVCTGSQPQAVIRQLTLGETQKWDCGSVRNPDFPRQVPAPGARVPTLDQVLELASRGTFDFNMETKIFPDQPKLTPSPEEFARLVWESVRKHRLEKRIILQSFDFRTLLAMKKLAPEIRLSALYAGPPRDLVAIAREAGADIVSPDQSLVTREQVRAAHRAGLQVVPWTANTPAQWDRLVTAGSDAIISDDPAALIEYLRTRGLR